MNQTEKHLDSIAYIKYSHISSIVLNAIPIVSLLLYFIFPVEALLIFLVIATPVSYGIMLVCQVVFLFKGYASLKNLEDYQASQSGKFGYILLWTYLGIFILGKILNMSFKSNILDSVFEFIGSLILLSVFYITFKLLKNSFDKHLPQIKNLFLISLIIVFILKTINLISNFINIFNLNYLIKITFGGLEYKYDNLLLLLLSVFIIISIPYYNLEIHKQKSRI